MPIIAAGATDVGRKRKANQDSFRMAPERGLYVIADGMGGHAGGELASRVCVDTIVSSIEESIRESHSPAADDLVMTAVHRANSAVYSTGKDNEKLRGMGTTVDMLLFQDNMLHIGHVGDSRVYLLRKNLIWQLTRDHSLVSEKLKAGLITRDQIKTDQNKNVITRSVGFESSVLVDLYKRETSPGDLYLACSDGLSGLVEDYQILNIMNQFAFSSTVNSTSLENAIRTLIQSANENGGDDNVTVITVQVV